MTPETPVHSLDECFAYLQSNSWQFKMLEPDSAVRINARMLRSLYYHTGCAKFGVPFNADIQQLAIDIAQRDLARKAGKT